MKSQLEPSDLKDAVAEARLVREGMAERLGDIVGELVSPLIYGVLAHAPHKKLGADPSATVSNTLLAEAEKYDSHPSKQLDIVCVADLDCWYRTVAVAQHELGSEKETEHDLYFDFWRSAYEPPEYATQSMPNANPVATLVTQLWAKLAARDPRLTHIAQGLRVTDTGSYTGPGRHRALAGLVSPRVYKLLFEGAITQRHID